MLTMLWFSYHKCSTHPHHVTPAAIMTRHVVPHSSSSWDYLSCLTSSPILTVARGHSTCTTLLRSSDSLWLKPAAWNYDGEHSYGKKKSRGQQCLRKRKGKKNPAPSSQPAWTRSVGGGMGWWRTGDAATQGRVCPARSIVCRMLVLGPVRACYYAEDSVQ